MLFTTRINNLVTAYPRLSRIWIKTGNSKALLKAVWINESQPSRVMNAVPAAAHDEDAAELAESDLFFLVSADDRPSGPESHYAPIWRVTG